AGGVGGGEVPQLVADLAAGLGDGLGGGDVLGDGAVSGRVGEGQTGADAAAHRVAVPDAAGVEPDQVVLVEDRGGQGRRHGGGHVQALERRAAWVQQQVAAHLARLGGGDFGYLEADGLAARVLVVQRHCHRAAFFAGVTGGALGERRARAPGDRLRGVRRLDGIGQGRGGGGAGGPGRAGRAVIVRRRAGGGRGRGQGRGAEQGRTADPGPAAT